MQFPPFSDISKNNVNVIFLHFYLNFPKSRLKKVCFFIEKEYWGWIVLSKRGKKYKDISFLKDWNTTTIGNKRNVAALRINRSCTKYTRHFEVTREIGNVKCKVIALQTEVICSAEVLPN